MSIEPIVARIRALLAKSVDPAATEAEAAAAASAAERLLARHALSMRDVEVQRIGSEKTGLRYLEPWVRNMAVQAARLYGCEPLVTTEKTWGVSKKTGKRIDVEYRSLTLYGRPMNTEVACSMISYLYNTVLRMSRDYSSARKEQLGFQRGAGERLATRLWELRQEQERRSETQDGLGDGTSLIVVEQNEAQEWLRNNIKMHKVRATGSNTSSLASHAGWSAAGDISLGGQIGGSESGPRRLN